jgi:hypothetical protein
MIGFLLVVILLALSAYVAWRFLYKDEPLPDLSLNLPLFKGTPPGQVVAASKQSGLKDIWPELVGQTARAARAAIQKEAPDAKIELVAAGGVGATDYNPNRVRIQAANEDDIVRTPPKRG